MIYCSVPPPQPNITIVISGILGLNAHKTCHYCFNTRFTVIVSPSPACVPAKPGLYDMQDQQVGWAEGGHMIIYIPSFGGTLQSTD